MTSVPHFDKLLAPKSVALVGASPNTRVGIAMVRNLRMTGYGGPIYPISATHRQVDGLRCYPALDDVPHAVDAVMVGTRRSRVIDAVRSAAAAHAAAIVVPAGGYAEAGSPGARDQEQLVGVVAQAGMLLCGPNCIGILNNVGGASMYIGVLERRPPVGAASLVLQSGSLAITIINNRRGLGFRYVLSTGNEAQLSAADYLEWLVEDPGTKVVGLALEAIRNPDRFLSAIARAISLGKRVVLLKLATSAVGKAIAASHTGALAGAAEVTTGVCRQHGIALVHDLEELLQTCLLMSWLPPGNGRGRLGGITLSGAAAALAVDLCQPLGLDFPPWGKAVADRLKEMTGQVSRNPFDAWDWTTGFPEESLGVSVPAITNDDNTDVTVVVQDIYPASSPNEGYVSTTMVDAIVGSALRSKPLVMIGLLADEGDQANVERLAAVGVPYLGGAATAFRALAHWARPPLERSVTAFTGKVAALDITLAALREAGVPLVADVLVQSGADARRAADRLGYPVVLKVISADVPHKTENGALQLDVNADHVEAAYNRVMRNALAATPGAAIDGVLVQRQAPPGIELIVGAHTDPEWGRVIVLGSGGIFVEVLGDATFRRVPLTEEDAAAMVRELRLWPVLNGARGKPPVDIGAIERLLLSTSRLMAVSGALVRSLDFNPVIAYPGVVGIAVVDVLIDLVGRSGSGGSHLT